MALALKIGQQIEREREIAWKGPKRIPTKGMGKNLLKVKKDLLKVKKKGEIWVFSRVFSEFFRVFSGCFSEFFRVFFGGFQAFSGVFRAFWVFLPVPFVGIPFGPFQVALAGGLGDCQFLRMSSSYSVNARSSRRFRSCTACASSILQGHLLSLSFCILSAPA